MSTSVVERRPLGALGRIGMVAGLHAAALYLIASSLGIVPPLIQERVDDVRLIDEREPPDDPLPAVPEAQPYDPKVYVPEPVAPPNEPADRDTETVVGSSDDPPAREAVPPPREALLVNVRQDARHPLSQPAYPQTDIRQGNEGTAEIEVFVLPDGRIGDARIVRSAGSPTLDQSAIDEARRKWRLLPATRDGEPYAQWHRLKVTFNLKNR